MRYLFIALLLSGCGYGNLDYIKQNSNELAIANGLEIVGYQGFEWQYWLPFTNYGGAAVWYTFKRSNVNVIFQRPSGAILYQGAFQRWGDEVHLYGLKAIDAIAPR